MEKSKDILAYATELTKFKGEPNGAIIVLISALIKRPITLVHQKGTWNSDLNDNHDIVMGYAGHNPPPDTLRATSPALYLLRNVHEDHTKTDLTNTTHNITRRMAYDNNTKAH